ncbi:uncharacterized protein CGFF_01958 [Nakaseomyces glabratus]|nr:Pre-mRNA 3'-end-processing endonuclease polyadenylation factor C-term [Nakaseomyces glabratus]QNG14120.1 uncharacterized protein GWK60_G09493 [Nakaseomyces glabratus]SCV14401.1 uncharacterized protein CGFF_01958 [Nakaseomyces glabratus]SLM13075.1 uncharacterized protein CGFF_01958 [Nakaseomyces glabratus]
MSKQNTLILRITEKGVNIDTLIHDVVKPRLMEIFESRNTSDLKDSLLYKRTIEMDEDDNRILYIGNEIIIDYREYQSSTHSYLLKLKWLQEIQPSNTPNRLDLFIIECIVSIIIANCDSSSISQDTNVVKDENERLRVIQELMEEQFGADGYKEQERTKAIVKVGDKTGHVDLVNLKVIECDSSLLKGRLEGVLRVAEQLSRPLIGS